MKWIDIDHPNQMYRGWFRVKNFRCKGSGYFYDGAYGFYSTTTYAKGFRFWLKQRYYNFWQFTIRQNWYNFKRNITRQ